MNQKLKKKNYDTIIFINLILIALITGKHFVHIMVCHF